MVTRRSGRPSRFRPHAYKRWRGARRIQRFWRRRRPRRVHNQRYNRVSNQLKSRTIKGARNPKSLRNRVKALEVSAKKHNDVLEYRKVPILSYGTATNISGQFGDDFLRIPPKNTFGEITPSDAPELAEDMVRDGDEVFIKSALIKFQLNTYTPGPGLSPADYLTWVQNVAQNQSLMHTRVVFTILQDMRPSQNDGQSTSVPNALPTLAGERPLESIYRRAGLYNQANNATMITFDTTMGDTNYGADNALMSYDTGRFKKVHQSTITLNSLTPSKLVEHRLVINRRAKYMQASQQSGDPSAPSYPVNFNYLLFLSTTSSVAPSGNLDVPESILDLCRPPTIDKLSIRTYFTDS